MSRTVENIRLYSATAAIFLVGVTGFSLLAPVDKRAEPYQNRLENGCFMLFGTAMLDRPGCFELQEDVTVKDGDDYFLWIKSAGVHVDLKGKTVTGPGQSSRQSGIYIEGGDDISISNGSVAGFMFGIRGEASSSGKTLGQVHIENMRISNSSVIGVKLVADNVTMRNTQVQAPAEASGRQFDYLKDISIEAKSCSYFPAPRSSVGRFAYYLARSPQNCAF